MGLMTFLQMREEILSYHANRVDLTTARLNRLIDLAQYRIARVTHWDDLKYTLLGNLTVNPVDTYPTRRADRLQLVLSNLMNTGFRYKNIILFKLTDDSSQNCQVLDGLLQKDFDKKFPHPDTYDRRMPTNYMVFGNRILSTDTVNSTTIEMFPAPDLTYAYTIRVEVYPRTISNGARGDNDVSDFQEHDDAIINYVVSQIYQSLGREDKAKEHFSIYGAILRELVDADLEDMDTNITGVKVEQSIPGNYWADPFIRSIR